MSHYYKVTDAEGRATHGGTFAYSLPTEDGPGEWTTPLAGTEVCSPGMYHITSDPTQWLRVGCRVWDVEHTWIIATEGDKAGVHSLRLSRERPDLVPDWWRSVEGFVDSIGDVPWFDPQGDPDPAWRVFDTRAAARDAAWDAARAAAWDAALMARVLVCDVTELDPAHRAHAEQRWDVWRRGYGLYGDVGGVLYVYRRLS